MIMIMLMKIIIVQVLCHMTATIAQSSPTVSLLFPGTSYFSNSLIMLNIATHLRSDTHEMVNITLGDFKIKFNELEFQKLIFKSSRTKIHQGRWHGEVVIHSCHPENDGDVQSWLSDVRALTHIRHENVVLYMGACVEPPNFAIVTSPVKVRDL